MADLKHMQVAVIATDGFEETELTEPVRALQVAGASVTVIAPHPGTIQGFRHHDKSKTVRVDMPITEAKADRFEALLLPGGVLNADAIRINPDVQSFVRTMHNSGKPIAAICHAPWILISAGLVRGRKLTSFHTIQDDLHNAGADWTDAEVVVDRNWVTSRKPADIPAFNHEMLNLFSKAAHSAERRQFKAAS